MVLYIGILPGTAAEVLGVSGVSSSRGTPLEALQMVVCVVWLGRLSSAP